MRLIWYTCVSNAFILRHYPFILSLPIDAFALITDIPTTTTTTAAAATTSAATDRVRLCSYFCVRKEK